MTGYVYTFNICKNVVSPPAACGTSIQAGAFQTSPPGAAGGTWCAPLSNSLSGASPPVQVSLIDSADPSYGINVTYLGYNGDAACQRAFHLILRCGYEPFLPADNTVNTRRFIAEVDNCHYEAYSWSLAGCPLECPVGGNGQLCSGAGVCGFDRNVHRPRCFCDDGFIENDCSVNPTKAPGGAIAGAFFGGAIATAAALLGTGFFLSRAAPSAATDGFYGAAAP